MLNQVEEDAKGIGMNKQSLVEESISRYGETLHQIGFSLRDILRLSSQGLSSV